MDRTEQLRSYSVRELVDELKRRKAELDGAVAEFTTAAGASAKNPRMSEAKAEYWRAWRAYKAQHPNASASEWRKSLKKGKR
jgi:ribosomal protein L29